MRHILSTTMLRLAARSLAHWLPHSKCRAICHEYGFEASRLDYMSPIPDIGALRPTIFSAESDSRSLSLDAQAQLQFLQRLWPQFGAETRFPKAPTDAINEFHLAQDKFTNVDAAVLWMMIRYLKPRRILEVGSGNSTRLMAAAAHLNALEGSDISIKCFDPHASEILAANPPMHTTVIRQSIEIASAEIFNELGERDILFVDSSHVVKCGSDVAVLVLNVLPRLRHGVVVHFHDIYLPFEYPRTWLENGYYYNESYFLHAFLSFNSAFKIVLANHYLATTERDALTEMFTELRGPSSLWLERV